MTARIFLVDDHHLVRGGIRLLLESEADFRVIGEAGDGAEAVEAAARLFPDVLVVDMVLPGLNGIEVTRELKRQLPELKVVALSMHDNEAYVFEALRAGASAYVLKKSTAESLVLAIRRALAGGIYLSPPLSESALREYDRRAAGDDLADGYELLTERERQVLPLAARGMKNLEIAAQLSLSIRTVEMHRANMMRKLRLKNRTELVRYAIMRGIVV